MIQPWRGTTGWLSPRTDKLGRTQEKTFYVNTTNSGRQGPNARVCLPAVTHYAEGTLES